MGQSGRAEIIQTLAFPKNQRAQSNRPSPRIPARLPATETPVGMSMQQQLRAKIRPPMRPQRSFSNLQILPKLRNKIARETRRRAERGLRKQVYQQACSRREPPECLKLIPQRKKVPPPARAGPHPYRSSPSLAKRLRSKGRDQPRQSRVTHRQPVFSTNSSVISPPCSF
jgi:hypothetical protein